MKFIAILIILISFNAWTKTPANKITKKEPAKTASPKSTKKKISTAKKLSPVKAKLATPEIDQKFEEKEKIISEKLEANSNPSFNPLTEEVPLGASNPSPLTITEFKDCNTGLKRARDAYDSNHENLIALQHIAECTKEQQSTQLYANQAKDIFQNSKIFSIVPKMLEVAQVKDLIPILNEVELKKDKTISDYLMLNEIYERLGEPEKQIQNLGEAINNTPDDPRPLFLLASKKIELGKTKDATELYNSFIDKTDSSLGKYYLIAYVLALETPFETTGGLVLVIWIISFFLVFRSRLKSRGQTDLSAAFPLLIAAAGTYFGFRFWQYGQAIPFGLMLIMMLLDLFLWLKPLLSKAYIPVFRFLGKWISFFFTGLSMARILNQYSLTVRIGVGVFAVSILLFVAPNIDIVDLRYAVVAAAAFAFYSTVGSLLVSFLRSRESLHSSLTWISIAATFPFLVSYFVANWGSIALPLIYARLPSPRAVDGLVNYLVFWGVSLFLAIHLGRIIADAIIQPLQEIIDKVSLIERGYFDAKVAISSKDEIGLLGEAINRMGSGLEKREHIEKTFHKYVDKRVVQKILDGDEDKSRIDGVSTDAVILFADIRGFTTFSEKSNPQDVVKILNQFFERMVAIVQKHDGMIDKFIGDNLMAVWGVPNAVQDAEEKAVMAALKMIAEMQNFNKHLVAQGYPQLAIGIGINSGKVIAGSIGSSDRMEYTVIGDVVNSAQRAESSAKAMQVLVTSETFNKVSDKFFGVEMEAVKVKGKDLLQHYWTVTGIRNSANQ